ncbi:hypothetical protein ElyMa_003193300 [Elysia marginata]|uniref:Uncharacterized protein n=1 Tax=Elysia marginata TaxID=1093978 RepID=A0AAV4J073_9GAST|nr:hypothetical protein ElyMa_003193300 [Elysia marginata]
MYFLLRPSPPEISDRWGRTRRLAERCFARSDLLQTHDLVRGRHGTLTEGVASGSSQATSGVESDGAISVKQTSGETITEFYVKKSGTEM